MKKRSPHAFFRLSVDEFKSSEKIPVVLVLDNIRSHHNIGSVFRSADAFRVESIWLCGITATPPHREIHKTALGATDSVAWQYAENTVAAIKELIARGYTIVAVEQVEESIMLQDFTPPPNAKLAFVFGNEVNGIADEVLELAHNCLEIPQFGTKHSINISVTVGIMLWHLFMKEKRNPKE